MAGGARVNPALYDLATTIVPMVFAIVFHEVAHGRMARALGDPTAAERGRLSLNPLRHVDPFGTVILPLALHLVGLPVFGWAKPVPVDYARLRRPKRDMALVGAAGPLANFALALLSAVALGLLARVLGPHRDPGAAFGFLVDNLQAFILFNAFLGMFNLLPIPPFDGSRILRGVLPWSLARWLDRAEPFGILVFFVLFVVLPQVAPGWHLVDKLILPPVDWLVGTLGDLMVVVAGG